jgi:hypothetical protein
MSDVPALAAAGLLVGLALASPRRKARRATRLLLEAELAAARRLYHEAQLDREVEKAALDNVPRPLRALARKLIRLIGEQFHQLAEGLVSPAEWMDLFRRLLARYHLAAFMTGNESEVVPARAWRGLVDVVNAQFEFLRGFKLEVQSDAEFQAGWEARAESYAGAIKVPYWQGRTKVLPLPAMPAQGTQCHNNCGCAWRVVVVNEKRGDYDAYWERHKDDSCQTCIERARQWAPVRIRDGILE